MTLETENALRNEIEHWLQRAPGLRKALHLSSGPSHLELFSQIIQLAQNKKLLFM